ncbi:hypothetical protein Poli38472_009886 [Pythium oligandrum]|uniref:Uncharacterized protein n=1 Tax=Pythium oligandrum TaxID=41045 RepID=A0A8K1CH43_PYTOL|nr:hypothetical protein Poli38472_009886 [Pythium oligandrum]|eukprot:TMW62393.1 hypothetical protein Poli38472_009886 [Pythium oligandrum]
MERRRGRVAERGVMEYLVRYEQILDGNGNGDANADYYRVYQRPLGSTGPKDVNKTFLSSTIRSVDAHNRRHQDAGSDDERQYWAELKAAKTKKMWENMYATGSVMVDNAPTFASSDEDSDDDDVKPNPKVESSDSDSDRKHRTKKDKHKKSKKAKKTSKKHSKRRKDD